MAKSENQRCPYCHEPRTNRRSQAAPSTALAITDLYDCPSCLGWFEVVRRRQPLVRVVDFLSEPEQRAPGHPFDYARLVEPAYRALRKVNRVTPSRSTKSTDRAGEQAWALDRAHEVADAVVLRLFRSIGEQSLHKQYVEAAEGQAASISSDWLAAQSIVEMMERAEWRFGACKLALSHRMFHSALPQHRQAIDSAIGPIKEALQNALGGTDECPGDPPTPVPADEPRCPFCRELGIKIVSTQTRTPRLGRGIQVENRRRYLRCATCLRRWSEAETESAPFRVVQGSAGLPKPFSIERLVEAIFESTRDLDAGARLVGGRKKDQVARPRALERAQAVVAVAGRSTGLRHGRVVVESRHLREAIVNVLQGSGQGFLQERLELVPPWNEVAVARFLIHAGPLHQSGLTEALMEELLPHVGQVYRSYFAAALREGSVIDPF